MADDDQDEDDCGEEEVDERVVIIDNGSGMCKAGLSDQETPKFRFPEIVGQTRSDPGKNSAPQNFFGEAVDAEIKKKALRVDVKYPLENGIIEDFELMELLWEYTFVDLLQVDPRNHPVLLTEPPYNPKPNREKMVEIMFETFGVPSLNISIQGVLALLGQGRTTGLVLDSGEGVTHTIPIFDGYGMPHCINRLDLAGRELNTCLSKLLALEGYILCTTEEQQHVRKMKETTCYCAMDPSQEFASDAEYKMPDGRKITLCDERWKCPEALFNPSLVGIESMGVAGLVYESIARCEIDLRKQLLGNVVLSGGSTMFPFFKERLLKELKTQAPSATQANIRIVPSKDQLVAVWSGAQVFASLREMQEAQWVTYEDFEEYGAAYIHDKIAVRYN